MTKEKRDNLISVRVTEKEMKIIDSLKQDKKDSRSTTVRSIALGHKDQTKDLHSLNTAFIKQVDATRQLEREKDKLSGTVANLQENVISNIRHNEYLNSRIIHFKLENKAKVLRIRWLACTCVILLCFLIRNCT